MSGSLPALHDDAAQPLGRGVAGVVLTGVLLGLGYNYLSLQGPPPHRGLPWIAKAKVLDHLESLPAPAAASATAIDPAPAPAQQQAPPEAKQPPVVQESASTPAPRAAAAPGVPEVPDLGRPLQVQLPMVKQLWDAGGALVIDAREPAEYAAGHIPGAINLPYDEVVGDPERLDAVDSGGRPIVCYCGGGSCEVSIHLAESLVYQAGKKRVLVFMGGFPEWEGAGYPVER